MYSLKTDGEVFEEIKHLQLEFFRPKHFVVAEIEI